MGHIFCFDKYSIGKNHLSRVVKSILPLPEDTSIVELLLSISVWGVRMRSLMESIFQLQDVA